MPVPAEQLPTGTVIVHGEWAPSDGVALYARVSKRRSNSGLRETIGLGSASWLASKGLQIAKAVKKVGFGRNGLRRGLLGQVCDRKESVILGEHRRQLMPFASEHLEGALGAHGRSILVVDPNEMTGDIVGDLDEEIVPLCARLY